MPITTLPKMRIFLLQQLVSENYAGVIVRRRYTRTCVGSKSDAATTQLPGAFQARQCGLSSRSSRYTITAHCSSKSQNRSAIVTSRPQIAAWNHKLLHRAMTWFGSYPRPVC